MTSTSTTKATNTSGKAAKAIAKMIALALAITIGGLATAVAADIDYSQPYDRADYIEALNNAVEEAAEAHANCQGASECSSTLRALMEATDKVVNFDDTYYSLHHNVFHTEWFMEWCEVRSQELPAAYFAAYFPQCEGAEANHNHAFNTFMNYIINYY